MLLIPLVVSQEKVKRTCSGSLEGSGEGVKLLKSAQVLFAKVEVNRGERCCWRLLRHIDGSCTDSI